MNQSKDVVEKIYQILREVQSENNFESSDNFIEDGLLDSFDIINLVASLDAAFGISISGRHIIPENFASVLRIAKLVCSKKL